MAGTPWALYTECPTPKKSRFATEGAAQSAADQAWIALGKRLYPYDTCPCGWVHLTSKLKRVKETPTLTGIAAFSDDAFAQVVRDDVRKIAHPDDSAALRHPENLERWRRFLYLFQLDLEKQLAAKSGDKSDETAEWRRRAQIVRVSIAETRDECKALINQRRIENTEKRKALKEQRHEAGERAIDRLIAAHREEFDRYLVEECELAGVDVPKSVRRHIELRELENEKETS